jgi:hypothetical protein
VCEEERPLECGEERVPECEAELEQEYEEERVSEPGQGSERWNEAKR